MIKQLFLFLIFFVSFSFSVIYSHGQKIRFTDTTNSWIMGQFWAGNGPPGSVWYYSESILDTIVSLNDKNYHMLQMIGGDIALVRDDTVNNVVYLKPLGNEFSRFSVNDTNEFVYLNYNLVIGDTLVWPISSGSGPNDDSVSYSIVLNVDSVFIGTFWYKKIDFDFISQDDGQHSYQVIEGIGSPVGPSIYPTYYSEYPPPHLVCFKNNDTIPSSEFSYCKPNGTKGIDRYQEQFQIFPNPAYNKISINYTGDSQGQFQVRIVNIVGTEMEHSVFNKSLEINIQTFPPGMYFVQILKDGYLIQNRKLVFAQ